MVEWTAIVITSPSPGLCGPFLAELKKRQKAGLIATSTILVAADDPGFNIGSGGATINALLMVTERLSAKHNYTVVNADSISDARILVLHLGGPFLCDPCGKAFTCFAATASGSKCDLVACNLDQLLATMSQLQSATGPPGVWVCSTQMLLSVPSNFHMDWEQDKEGIVCIAVPGTIEYARQHGVYHVDDTGSVIDLTYRGSDTAITQATMPDGRVPLVSGVLWLCPNTAERLLALHTMSPLDGCTYIGLDSGAEPVVVSLFLDIVLAALPNTVESDFVQGCTTELQQRARACLLSHLKGLPVRSVVIDGGRHVYMPESFALHRDSLFSASPHRDQAPSDVGWCHLTHASGVRSFAERRVTVINSIFTSGVTVGDGTAVVHSHLGQNWHVGQDCYLMGVDGTVTSVALNDGMALMQVHMREQHARSAWVLLGVNDAFDSVPSIQDAVRDLSFCGRLLSQFLHETGISASELWPEQASSGGPVSLRTARLFPIARLGVEVGLEDLLWMQDPSSYQDDLVHRVATWRQSWRVSLQDIMSSVSVEAEFEWRDALFLEVASRNIQNALLHPIPLKTENLKGLPGVPSPYFVPVFAFFAIKGNTSILQKLDHVAATAPDAGRAARALACIADALAAFADGGGGLRSGPGCNPDFAAALKVLDTVDRAAGVHMLAQARSRWLHTADALVRAARHYEAAAQILIRHAVMTAFQFVTTRATTLPARGQWVEVRCASRLDIAGGWSDTPPVTYEHGGAVVNAAITINGRKPIVVRACRIAEPVVRLSLGTGAQAQRFNITTTDEVATYTQPHTRGALVKAALYCTGLVDVERTESLQDQLTAALGGGIEMHTETNLPTGSGLGTSSILAGAVLAAVYRVCGKEVDDASLNHATLYLEQLMTTGGGWQDQVGGICGGVKFTTSRAELPLHINVESLALSSDFVQTFSSHLLLVFTGKTRLAKNLLQEVVRNWYARSTTIVQNTNELVANAERCAEAFRQEDLAAIGACLNEYRRQKRVMAPSCEPEHVRRLMDLFQDHAHGQALAGAGGGGFMFVITKRPHMRAAFDQLIEEHFHGKGVTCYDVALDTTGLVVDVLDAQT